MEPIQNSRESNAIPKSGRIGRMAEQIRLKAGERILFEVMRDVNLIEAPSNYPKKAAWLREAVQKLERLCSELTAREIMQECGRACFGPNNSAAVKRIKQASISLEEFIDKLNGKRLGGGRLKVIDANTIAGGYDRCYCGQVKQTKEPFPTLTYCHCSTGWYRQLFEAALERPVNIQILQSIITGSDRCEFLIHLE